MTVRIGMILAISILVTYHVDVTFCRPTEEPTKFTLGTDQENTQNTVVGPLSRLDQGKELLGRVMDRLRIGRGRIVNSVSLARNIIVDRAETLVTAAQTNIASITSPKRSVDTSQVLSASSLQPVVGRETVHLENENEQALLERPLSKTVGTGLETLFNPTPLLDGIREEEKYGNTGDRFSGITRAVVNGYEGFSNFLNALVDIPRNAVRNTSRSLTEALNQVGARIIGLQ